MTGNRARFVVLVSNGPHILGNRRPVTAELRAEALAERQYGVITRLQPLGCGITRGMGPTRTQNPLRTVRYSMTLTGGSFRPDVHAVLADDTHVVLLVRCSAEREGKRYDWLAADAYHVDDGKITEHWIMEGDQHAVDELFHA